MPDPTEEPTFITPPMTVPLAPPTKTPAPPTNPTQPPQATSQTPPPIPPIPPTPNTPSGPNKFKRFFQGSKLKYLFAIPLVLMIAIVVFGYMIFAKGQTVLGEKLQDKIWQTIIDNSNKDAKEMELSVTYTDTGTYKFVPSNFVKPFEFAYLDEDPYREQGLKEMDQRYSFTISNLTTSGTLQTYFDFRDKDKPKVDAHVVGKLSNNQKDFEISGDLKLKDDEAYGKYDYNSNVEDLINYLLGGVAGDSGTSSGKNQWHQTKDENSLKQMRNEVQLIAQIKDSRVKSDDAKRLSDIRQLSSALELYFDSEGQYPEAENDKPKGLTNTYLAELPTAPTPPGGNCSDDMNNYRYQATKDNSGRINNYQITFCIGTDVGSFTAGNYQSTPNGISSYDCPSSRVCSNPNNNQPDLQTEYQKLLRDNRLFDIKSFKGVSLMDGKPVVHYNLELNKDKLKEVVTAVTNKTFDSEYDKDIKNFVNELSNEFIAKINVENYDVWVGVADHKLYKSSMTINALSVTKAADYFEKSLNDPNNPITKGLKESNESAKSKARDARRISDARMIASALELYYNDHNEYPAAENGVPLDLDPTYMETMPTAPLPPDGKCSEYDNIYWYTKTSPNSYKFNFCLGQTTGGIQAGVVTLTEKGFDTPNNRSGLQSPESCPDGYSCTDYPDQSKSIFESFKSTVINTIRNLDFNAKIQVEYSAKNIGKTRDIEAPKDFVKEPDYGSEIIID